MAGCAAPRGITVNCRALALGAWSAKGADMREIVWDTETTGIMPGDGHRIVEIGRATNSEPDTTANQKPKQLVGTVSEAASPKPCF